MRILVIDIGTTSTKGMVYDENLNLLSECRVPAAPEFLDDVHVQESPQVWCAALEKIGKHASDKKIDAVALTAQRSSVFPADSGGNPLHPAIMWQDRRTDKICAQRKALERNVYEKTGLLIKPVYGAPKMAWFRQNMPEVYEKTERFMTVADLCVHFLTGSFVTDTTYGNRSLLMNLHTGEWDRELMKIFGVERRMLPDLIQPGSMCGKISKSFHRLTGLQEGIPVYTPGGDQQTSALGLGVLEPGRCEITHGTGSYLLAHSEKPWMEYEKKISCNVSAVPGKYIVEIPVMTTGAAYEWFQRSFYPENKAGESCFCEINREAAQAGPFAGGVVMFPDFQGSCFPNWNTKAKGSFFHVDLHTTRGDMARAVLEGIAAKLSDGLEEVDKRLGPVQEVALSGGLSAIEAFSQMQADIYERETVVYADRESTAIGAWMSAMVSCGRFPDYSTAFAKVQECNAQKRYHPDYALSGEYRRWKSRRRELEQILEEKKTHNIFYPEGLERGKEE